MKIQDIKPADILVHVDGNGAGYFKVLKVNRVTIDVLGENGIKARCYPEIFDRKITYPIAAFST